MSREHFTKVFLKEHPPIDSSIPGPGTYYNKRNYTFERDSVKFTFRPKTSNDSSIQDFTKGYPGPGAYSLNDTKNGYCIYSRYKSNIAPTISRNGKRFDVAHLRTSLENPGPGTY